MAKVHFMPMGLVVDAEFRKLARAAHYSVQEYALRLALSPRQLDRLFQRELGGSPRRALDEARLVEAKALLLAGQPVKAVAAEVCFQHASSFDAWFEARTGCRPTEFVAAHCPRILRAAPSAGRGDPAPCSPRANS